MSEYLFGLDTFILPSSQPPPPPAPAAGAVITASKIILDGWQILAAGDVGIFVITPGGLVTKLELIDFSQTPVPPTAPLVLQTAQASVPSVAVGPGKPGAIHQGNYASGNPHTTTTNAETPVNPVGDQTVNNSAVPVDNQAVGPGNNPGVGTGYSSVSDAGKQTLIKYNITDPAFVTGLEKLAQQLNAASDNLIVVFYLESKLRPNIQNSLGYTGLNQMGRDTAQQLGYTVEQIKNMTATEQITGPITKFFISGKRYLPANPSMADLYMVNFYPLGCGKPDEWIIGSPKADGTVTKEKSATYIAGLNKPFAMGGSVITVGSFKKWLNTQWKPL